jgi:hypothetical protein
MNRRPLIFDLKSAIIELVIPTDKRPACRRQTSAFIPLSLHLLQREVAVKANRLVPFLVLLTVLLGLLIYPSASASLNATTQKGPLVLSPVRRAMTINEL